MASAAGLSFGTHASPVRLRLPSPAHFRLHRLGSRLGTTLAERDLLVDLGDHIGSGRWWRGAATLTVLIGAVGTLALQIPTLTAAVPQSRTAATLDEARPDAISPLALGSRTGRVAPPASSVRRLTEAPERPRIELRARVGEGGLESALRRSGIGRADLLALGGLLNGTINMRGLKPSTELVMVLGRRESRADARPLQFLGFRSAFDMRVEVSRSAPGDLGLKKIPIKVDNTPLRVTGSVGGSLNRAARAAGLSASVVADFVKQMSYVVDFQREVGGKDRFDFIVSHRRAETGETEMGQLLYAGLQNGKEQISLMRWGSNGAFYRASGEGAKKGLMRTPVDGARLSSGFGMRFHPILGFSRMHQGVDFAAPTGTPVLASAAGRVVQSGWGGGYGNVIRVDHGRGVVTRYAHLSRLIARVGQNVGQGQSIGLVGTTGLSTGAHLHYEVWQNGRPVDPRQTKFQTGTQLGGGDLSAFKAQMAQLKRIAAAGGGPTVSDGVSDGVSDAVKAKK